MSKEIAKVTFGSPDRPLKIGSAELSCYVLDNDKRVFVLNGMIKALGMSPGSAGGTGDRLSSFIDGRGVKPFISNELRDMITKPIKFNSPTGIAYGYEATILVDICDAVIQANKAGALQKQQQHIAEQAEMLIRAFAKTGIIALVDEATGFQKAREKDALQQFLDKFLQDEQAKWVKTFPDDFFEMIFKLKNWTWHYASTKKPQVVGHYINDFIYSRLGPQVLEELRKRNIDPQTGKKKGKQFQFLTTDYGHPKLKEHISAVIALGRASGYNWRNFQRLLNRAFPKFGDTLSLDLDDDINLE